MSLNYLIASQSSTTPLSLSSAAPPFKSKPTKKDVWRAEQRLETRIFGIIEAGGGSVQLATSTQNDTLRYKDDGKETVKGEEQIEVVSFPGYGAAHFEAALKSNLVANDKRLTVMAMMITLVVKIHTMT